MQRSKGSFDYYRTKFVCDVLLRGEHQTVSHTICIDTKAAAEADCMQTKQFVRKYRNIIARGP